MLEVGLFKARSDVEMSEDKKSDKKEEPIDGERVKRSIDGRDIKRSYLLSLANTDPFFKDSSVC